MRRVVEEQRLAFVATVCADGTPNLSPKGTIAVVDDDHLAFADVCSPATIANLARNPAIEINVVDVAVRKGYRFKGKAHVHGDGPRFEELLAFYRHRGTTLPIKHVVLVRIESAAEVISPAYDQGASEEDVASRWEAHWRDLWQKRRTK
jgi:predicted pyridoxine 5'-phosphate oxidase superfamily flavin-nucleotide-binding protein